MTHQESCRQILYVSHDVGPDDESCRASYYIRQGVYQTSAALLSSRLSLPRWKYG